MPEKQPFQIEQMTYLKATLPNGRKAQLLNGILTVWTRQGEELQFDEESVLGMKAMFDKLKVGQG